MASENRKGRRRKLKGKRGRGTLAEEKPPVLGIIQRHGEVVIAMLPNVQQVTIQPLMTKTIQAGSLVYTDEYNIYDPLDQWGYHHKSINHSAGEYVRDEDGDGFHEVHVNTMEGFWSLLRSWLRPHTCLWVAVFHKKNCLAILPSLNLYTMSVVAARLCFIPYLLFSLLLKFT